jgi:hypothetical protein
MKNFKKVIAAAAAVAMTMSIGVSAMAATTASYADGKVTLADVGDTVNSANQWTVIVIAADKANATLEAADLYYINQGDNGEAFWTNGLGVKTELAAGDYIVRIGGEDLSQVVEIPFTVGSTGYTHQYGDVDFSGDTDLDDAVEIINYALWEASVLDDDDPERMFVANVTKPSLNDDDVDLDDAIEIINYALWEPSVLDDLLGE